MCLYFMPSQNMLIWYMDYFELVIFKEQQTQGKLRKLSINNHFCKGHLHLQGQLFLVRVFPSHFPEERDDKYFRNSYQWRGSFKHQLKSALEPYPSLLCFV